MPTREEILARARHGDPKPLHVPEWGDEPVYIRVLSAKDQLSLTDGVDAKDMPFKVLVGCVCDADGEPIFRPEDEEALQDFPFPVIMRVFTAAARVNGLSSTELEEAVSHFEPAQAGANSSG